MELDQIHDLNMCEMIENGRRGGMCQVSHKHIKANNKYIEVDGVDVLTDSWRDNFKFSQKKSM